MESNSYLHTAPSTSAALQSVDTEDDTRFDDIFDNENLHEPVAATDGSIERAGTPDELIEAAGLAANIAIPLKSKGRYDHAYDQFSKWKQSKKTVSNSERVVVAYFSELAKSKKPSSLWSTYSMVKSKLKLLANIDISTYNSLTAFLKQNGKGYVPKKAKIFTDEEMQRFLDSAPDVVWLDVKV